MNYTALNKLAQKMGFGRVRSFSTMYKGGTANAYGKIDCSFTMFTIQVNVNDEVVGVEVNTKYLEPTAQSIKVNELCNFQNPMTIEELLTKF